LAAFVVIPDTLYLIDFAPAYLYYTDNCTARRGLWSDIGLNLVRIYGKQPEGYRASEERHD
jgi:hypothetical protein